MSDARAASIPVQRHETDVLIVGAGPAGCAAAQVLATGGLRVTLVDRHTFPRDKVCGDALIPDALQALSELGLRERVLSEAHVVRSIRLYAPGGEHTAIDGLCACLPRARLDELLYQEAAEAGATFLGRLRVGRPLEDRGIVRGAWFDDLGAGSRVEIRARVTLLATGAAADVLQRFDVCLRTRPSATAARCYVRVDPAVAQAHDHLCISFEASLCPGYAWIFPCPDHVFNIGIGYVYGENAPAERNIRTLLDRFLRTFPPAAALARAGAVIAPLKGAPLRMALSGARLGRPGLLVLGEAAGLTYSFTGEGIGKALQSGIIAATTVLGARDLSDDALRLVAETYPARIVSEFGARFRAYARLQDWMAWPGFPNLLVRRANRGRYVRAELTAMLNETGPPGSLISVPGLLRALVT